jgi:hypothetical protein
MFSTPMKLSPRKYWISSQFPEAESGGIQWMTSKDNIDGNGYSRTSPSTHWQDSGYSLAFKVEVGFSCNHPSVAKCKGIVIPIGKSFSIYDKSSYPDGRALIIPEQLYKSAPVERFDAAGVYDVNLKVVDDRGTEDRCSATVVAYDPTGGFVTGGGWIITSFGKANFGFVCKYKKGASVPTGQVEFVYDDAAGGVKFHSESFDYLMIDKEGKAEIKGSGTINGETGYIFELWAYDNDDLKQDEFGIKIWLDDKYDQPIFDHGPGKSIDGGSIKIHTQGGSIRG